MKSFIYMLINPITWLVVGLFFLWRRRKKINRKAKRTWLVIACVYFYLITTSFIPQVLIARFERKFQPLDANKVDTRKCYHIISLGGGVGSDTLLPANSLLSSTSLVRLAEAIRVYNLLPCKKIITSGKGAEGSRSLAEIAGEAAVSLGVNQKDLDFLAGPTNTEEEAQAYVEKFGTNTPLIISTTAIHMPRAVYIFQKKGVKNILAAPTDYKKKGHLNFTSLRTYLPGYAHFADLKGILHEIIGLAYIKVK